MIGIALQQRQGTATVQATTQPHRWWMLTEFDRSSRRHVWNHPGGASTVDVETVTGDKRKTDQ